MEKERPQKALSLHLIVQQAMNEAFEKISSSNLFDPDDIHYPEIADALNEMRKIDITAPEYSLEWIHDVARLAEEYRVGNCCEKTCFVFTRIEKMLQELHLKFNLNMEIFNNPFSDHFFIVIDRPPASNSADPQTWSPSTIICDPWKETKPYSIQNISFEELKNQPYTMIQYLIDSSEEHPSLILKQNIYSSSLDEHDENLPEIIEQDVMVLRSRLNLDSHDFQRFNHHIPIVFEDWDRPSPEEGQHHKLSPL
jgi:hypothetical protein